jgi:hypothetical protein
MRHWISGWECDCFDANDFNGHFSIHFGLAPLTFWLLTITSPVTDSAHSLYYWRNDITRCRRQPLMTERATRYIERFYFWYSTADWWAEFTDWLFHYKITRGYCWIVSIREWCRSVSVTDHSISTVTHYSAHQANTTAMPYNGISSLWQHSHCESLVLSRPATILLTTVTYNYSAKLYHFSTYQAFHKIRCLLYPPAATPAVTEAFMIRLIYIWEY